MAVERRQMSAQPAQVHERRDSAQQMVRRDHRFHVTLIEKLTLPVVLTRLVFSQA